MSLYERCNDRTNSECARFVHDMEAIARWVLSLFAYRKVGGLHFMRVSRLCVSFCITRKGPC